MKTKQVPIDALRCVAGPLSLGDNGDAAKTAPFRMVARSGDPIDHWYWGRIIHDLSGVNHDERIPIDYCHDDKEVIGFANKFDDASGDLVVSGALVPYKDNDRASEIVHKYKNGVPYQASIFFANPVIEDVPPNRVVEVNGRKLSGPLAVVRSWKLRGVAVCPYGADANTNSEFSSQNTTEIFIMSDEDKRLSSDAEVAEETTAVEAAAVEAEDVVNTVESAETPDVETETEPAAEPVPAVAELKTGRDYLNRFGEVGGVWFAEGKSWDEAIEAFEQKLKDRITELEAEVKSLRQSGGEAEPVGFTAEPHQPKRKFADRIQIVGRQKNPITQG